VKYRRIVHISLVRLLCPSTEKKDKISSAHNQIDAGNLLSNVYSILFYSILFYLECILSRMYSNKKREKRRERIFRY
jgi:hypothetical protein